MVMLFVVFVVSHWTACSYFAFTLYPPYSAVQDGTDWLPGSAFTSAPLSFLAYQRAFHFAVSFLTANGPILSPQTSGQYLFTDAITIFGKFCIAYLVCTISTALTDLTASQTQFGALMFRMNAFLRQHVAPAELCQRINKHFQHRFSLGLDVQTTLNMLPIHLHASITLELAGDLLNSMRLFAPGDTLSESRSESLIRALASELQFEAFPDGAFVYRSGEVGCKMYIVCGGRVELFADTVEELTTIEEIGSESDVEQREEDSTEPPASMPAYRRSMSIDAFAHLDDTIVEEEDSNDDCSSRGSAPASSRDEPYQHTVSRGGVFGERGLTLTSRLVNARAIGALSVLSLSAESCTKLGRAGFHELEQRIAVIARSTIDSDVAGK
jgi:CRP-like cAMP-binding protein